MANNSPSKMITFGNHCSQNGNTFEEKLSDSKYTPTFDEREEGNIKTSFNLQKISNHIHCHGSYEYGEGLEEFPQEISSDSGGSFEEEEEHKCQIAKTNFQTNRNYHYFQEKGERPMKAHKEEAPKIELAKVNDHSIFNTMNNANKFNEDKPPIVSPNFQERDLMLSKMIRNAKNLK